MEKSQPTWLHPELLKFEGKKGYLCDTNFDRIGTKLASGNIYMGAIFSAQVVSSLGVPFKEKWVLSVSQTTRGA